ncbi:hypothetical protein GEMRC1_001051 [Eukaryota sp. GEM-RC1]
MAKWVVNQPSTVREVTIKMPDNKAIVESVKTILFPALAHFSLVSLELSDWPDSSDLLSYSVLSKGTLKEIHGDLIPFNTASQIAQNNQLESISALYLGSFDLSRFRSLKVLRCDATQFDEYPATFVCPSSLRILDMDTCGGDIPNLTSCPLDKLTLRSFEGVSDQIDHLPRTLNEFVLVDDDQFEISDIPELLEQLHVLRILVLEDVRVCVEKDDVSLAEVVPSRLSVVVNNCHCSYDAFEPCYDSDSEESDSDSDFYSQFEVRKGGLCTRCVRLMDKCFPNITYKEPTDEELGFHVIEI